MGDGRMMSERGGWRIVEAAARVLPAAQREAVLGDLFEARDGLLGSLRTVLWLGMAQRAAELAPGHPWTRAAVVGVPVAMAMVGMGVALSRVYGLPFPLCLLLLGVAAVWIGLANRALATSSMLAIPVCLFCFPSLDLEGLTRLALCVMLAPALLSLWCLPEAGALRIRTAAAVVVAGILTLLTVPLWAAPGAWIPNWALSWPAWYVAAAGARGGRRIR